MYKVIVERPRLGGWPLRRGRVEQRARQEPEQAPNFESTSRGRGSKHLNENLAPLRRYLLRQVGRPWDRVHAEISANLRVTSAVQRHVHEHLEQLVVLHVVLRDGRPLRMPDLQPVLAHAWRGVVYVEPRTGLLRASPRRRSTPPPAPRDRVALPDGHQLQRLGGVWYHLILLPVPAGPERRFLSDVVLGERLDTPEGRLLSVRLKAQYGRDDVYAARKIQLGKRALARLLPEGFR